MKTNRIRKAKAVYSELAIEMESNTVVCIWAGTERQADRGKAFSGKREVFGVPHWRLLASGSYRLGK